VADPTLRHKLTTTMQYSEFTTRNRIALQLTIGATLASLVLVTPAVAQGSGGFCNGTINNVFQSVFSLAIYGGFGMAMLSYVGGNALMSVPGIGENQEERLKNMQSKAIRNGIKIFAIPVIILAINSATGGALPIADCVTDSLTPWI
jgi:hypothetical protein